MVCAAFTALLSGCPTVDLGDTPDQPGSCMPAFAYFQDTMWPQYFSPSDTSKSCVSAAGCHRASDGRSALRFQTDPVDDQSNYDVVTRFLNCGSPESSAALTKPLSGVDPHGGGDLFAPGSSPQSTFLAWFAPQ